jgi:putative DNA primase/helicase
MSLVKIESLIFSTTEKSKTESTSSSSTTTPGTIHPYGQQAVEQAVKAVLEAADGTKHDTLLKQARLLGGYVAGGLLGEEVACEALETAINSRSCDSYPAAYKTIRDGIKSGMTAPIDAQTIQQQRREYAARNAPAPAREGTAAVPDDDVIRLNREGERGLAELLALLHGERFRYDHTRKGWMVYQGGVWRPDETRQVRREAIKGLQAQLLEVSNRLDERVRVQLTNSEAGEQARPLEVTRDALRSTVRRLNRKATIEAVLDLATSFAPVVTTAFDRDPLLFNVKNGTLNLKTGTFQPHRPADLLSKQAGVAFVPGAGCPEWEKFLRLIFNEDLELIAFVQRCVGYTLTGLSDLQAVLFCYGSGGNGKSAFFGVKSLLMGDYYKQIPTETLLTKQRDGTDAYQLAGLKGARAVVGSEVPEGRRLNESLVKDLTGSEGINARVPYGLPFVFRPSHTMWLFGNHRPVVRGSDAGIWRRIHLIPFSVAIPPEKRQPMHQVMATFERELPGILGWALDGLREYFRGGLRPPTVVLEATQSYRDDSDVMGAFLEENCNLHSDLSCPARHVYGAYTAWCLREQEQPAFRNTRQFYNALRERGFTVKEGTDNVLFVKGMALKKPG